MSQTLDTENYRVNIPKVYTGFNADTQRGEHSAVARQTWLDTNAGGSSFTTYKCASQILVGAKGRTDMHNAWYMMQIAKIMQGWKQAAVLGLNDV